MQIAIPKQVEWILGQLKEHGYEAYAVGGCVRDTLLGREPEDWDITTSAKPEQVKQVFGRTIDTGLQHGTVTVLCNRVGYEITTYRIDGEYEDGRHPKAVSFTTDLREDLCRRDFTINAMAYSHETGIVDVFGGIDDLEKRVVRCVGDARARFTEDALRILRAIRFSAQLDFAIEEQTFQALPEIAPNLAQISKERMQVELTKMLLSVHPERILLVDATGMSPYISVHFPEVFSRADEGKADQRQHLLLAAGLPARKVFRWAAFLSGAGEDLSCLILKELKMDNDTIRQVRTLTKWFGSPLPEEIPTVRRLMSSMEDELFDDLLTLKETLIPEQSAFFHLIRAKAQRIRQAGDCIRMKDLAVTGKELISFGIRQGPGLGQVLNRLFEHVLDHPKDNRPECLLELAAHYKNQEIDMECKKG